MDTVFTLLKDNAPVAVMILITALYFGEDSRAVRDGMAEIRDDLDAIRDDLTEVRTEMASNNQAIRAEMAGEFKAVRAEMAGEFGAVRAEMANTNERLARVEIRLDSIENRLYMDTARPPI